MPLAFNTNLILLFSLLNIRMIKKHVSIAFIICFCSFLVNGQTQPKVADFQAWTDTSVTIPVYKNTDEKGKKKDKILLVAGGIFRFGLNATRPVDEIPGFYVNLDFKVNKYLTLTPGYYYVTQLPAVGKRLDEHRPRFAATLEKSFKNFSLKDRNQFEYRFRENARNSVRYRNKFTFTLPIRKEKKDLFSLFATTEPFYDFRQKVFTRTEFSVGIAKKFTKNYAAEFFFLRQDNRTGVKLVNAIGVNFKIKVD